MKVCIIGYDSEKNNFINYLFENNNDCFILDLNYNNTLEIKEGIINSNRYKSFKDSLLSYDLIYNKLNEYSIDVIIYFQTHAKNNNLFETSLDYSEDHIIVVKNLLEACKEHKKLKKFIYISSKNSYEAANLSSELIINSYYNSFDLPIIIVHRDVFELNIILKFIEKLNNNEKLTIESYSSKPISFLDINDYFDEINIITNNGKIGETYNICNYEKYTILDVAKILIKHLKNDYEYSNWITNDCKDFGSYKYQNKCNNNEKLKDLGWEIKTSFEKNLFNLMKPFYKNIPENFDPILYKNLNYDLKEKNFDYFDCIYHYETEGYKENRDISLDLNFKVFVYCCGKSGSSTLYKTFSFSGFNTLQVHSSYYYSNHLIESQIEPNLFNLINNCSNSNDEIYLIDVYRTPIEKKISSFFQNISNEDLGLEFEEIEKKIDINIYEIENYVSINEVLDYFNLPRFKDFDFEKKYNLLKYKNINIIKLRFQDINNWESILTDIFKRPIHLVSENISENKIEDMDEETLNIFEFIDTSIIKNSKNLENWSRKY